NWRRSAGPPSSAASPTYVPRWANPRARRARPAPRAWPCPSAASPGTRPRRAILSSIWCIIVVPPRRGSMSTPCRWSAWRPAGAVQAAALTALYEQMGWDYNLFQPVRHLVSKTGEGGRVRRRGDGQTPYQRLQASGVVGSPQQQAWAARYAATNPRQVRAALY